MKRIRVLVADDHPVFLEGMCTILSLRDPEVEVVGTARDGAEALQQTRERDPDVVLLDIKMPRMSGVEAAKKMVAEKPERNIIMLTTFDDRELIMQALRAGAKGYILKDAPAAQIIQAIKTVHSGNALFSPQILDKLSGAEVRRRAAEAASADASQELTSREWDIVRLMARGRDNSQIADELFLSEKTVRNYVSRIYEVLGVHNRTQAVLWAIDRGVTGESSGG